MNWKGFEGIVRGIFGIASRNFLVETEKNTKNVRIAEPSTSRLRV
jgi:hypothetical protein